MYLTAYDFTGPRDALLAGWHRMAEQAGADVDLHIAVVTDTGLTILDACPDKETMEHFSTSPEFLGLVDGCGLPRPVVRPLGEVHAAIARSSALTTPAPA